MHGKAPGAPASVITCDGEGGKHEEAKVSMMAVMLGLMTWMAIVMMTETTLVMRGMVMKRRYDDIVGYSDGRGISSEK